VVGACTATGRRGSGRVLMMPSAAEVDDTAQRGDRGAAGRRATCRRRWRHGAQCF
jgi:hypothetical protein